MLLAIGILATVGAATCAAAATAARSSASASAAVATVGFATTVIDAINKGQIYRYISKPWEDNDITVTIKLALQQKMLEREKRRLEALTHKQNEELKDLNANLALSLQSGATSSRV